MNPNIHIIGIAGFTCSQLHKKLGAAGVRQMPACGFPTQ